MLIDELKKAGSSESQIGSESVYFKPKASVVMPIPIFNLANSGSLTEGLSSGVTIIAGPSRHFKTTLALIHIKAYLDKHEDGLFIFFDSEFGVTRENLIANGIDLKRFIHVPILDVEKLKFDIVAKLEKIKRGQHVIFLVDSIGNLASKKEVEDAHNENEAADMSRAKAIKSLFRIITPHFTIKDIPIILIAHVYSEQKMYGKTIVSGGTGIMLSANNVWIIGRAAEKDSSKNIIGYKFNINIEKSRMVKEKSKFEFDVSFDGGINRWSGLLQLAVEAGHVVKPKKGYYSKVDTKTGEFDANGLKEGDTNTVDFWLSILKDKTFQEFTRQKYQLATASLQQDEE